MSEVDLNAQMMDLAAGCFAARAVHVAAELGIADLLGDGPRAADALARETRTHAPSLYRLLRALASVGVLEHQADDLFALTELGATLVSNAPGSTRAGVLLFGMWWGTWEQLAHSVRTGEPAATRVFGQPVFEHLAMNGALSATFHEGMSGLNASLLPAIVEAYEFAQHHVIVDVAGGHGTLLATVLEAAPASTGVLFDLPEVLEVAQAALYQRGLEARVRCIAGDMMESVPSGADAYLLKWILHDWDDEVCATILANVRAAMQPGSRLLIVDRVLPERADADAATARMMMTDLRMLAALGGRERTATQLRDLLEAAGLRTEEIIATGTPCSVIVASLTGNP